MRTTLCLLMILAGALTLACQNNPPTNSVPHRIDTQPANPLNSVTDPMHQPGFDSHGLPR